MDDDEQAEVMTIKHAAAALGVSMPTLRRWDKARKFVPHRHPVSGFRLYRVDEVRSLRAQILGQQGARANKVG